MLGTTGMESGEVVQAVVAKLKPDCVLAVDALASPEPGPGLPDHPDCRHGHVPGSGVGNARAR